MRFSQYAKVALSAVLVLLAIVRFGYHDALSGRMDVIFFSLILAAFLVWLIPWERLQSVTVGSVGISLEQPQVQAAISGLDLDRIEDEELRRRLLHREKELQSVRGGRILWIDDKPHNVLGERRLLKALGMDVTPAMSSEAAEKILEEDNDFDLIITDVYRRGVNYKLIDGGEPVHEGTNFIVKLRRHDDKHISHLPVIFYAAYDWERLIKFTRPARELLPEPEISNSAVDLIPKVISTLSEERAKPITYTARKQPTSMRRDAHE
jgi:CheY-like chemotaxis protein